MAEAEPPQSTIVLGRAHFSAFNDALESIAAQAHVAIVAEGIPLHPALADKEIPSLAGQDRPLSQVVKAVAAAYDYDVRYRGPVIVLVKRYSDPADLPSVTIGEWVECLREIKRLTDPFNPRVQFGYHAESSGDPLVGDLAASFTPAQLVALKGVGLRLNALNSMQIALVRRFALYLYVQQWADAVSLALSRLDPVGQEVVFHYADVQAEKHIFGFDMALEGAERPLVFARLSGPSCGFGLLGTMPFDMAPGIQDPSEPGAALSGAALPPGSTLAGVVAGINAGMTGPTTVEIDSCLGTKVVTFVGAANASPRDAVAAIADAYGLSVKSSSSTRHSVLRLGLPMPPPALERAAELPWALDIVVPPPLLRSMHAREMRGAITAAHRASYLTYRRGPPPDEGIAQAVRNNPWEDETLPQLNEAMNDRQLSLDQKGVVARFDSTSQAGTLPGKLRIDAVKRLRALLEQRVAASPDRRVAFSALTGQERDAFAFIIGSECLFEISRWVSRPPPEYVAGFNHLTLLGGLDAQPDGNHQTFALFFGGRLPDGRVDRGDGIAGAQYVK